MQITRREFLLQTGQACLGYALGAAAFAAGVARFGLINAFAQGSDYRALVCVFLAGGNDGNNMVIPTTATEYNAYATRPQRVGAGIPLDTLLPITPPAIGSPLRPASEPRRRSGPVGRSEAVGRVQRRSPRAAADARGLPGRRAQALSAVLALGPDRAVAVGHRRSRLADRMGRPHRRSVRGAPIGLPDDHRDLGRPLHARPDHAARSPSRRRRRRSIRCSS